MHLKSSAGFTLVEALIAAALLAAAVIGFAQLVTRAAQQTLRARYSAITLSLAQAKLEQLRSVAWDFDQSGAQVSSAELAFSPENSIASDVPPFVDALDRFGNAVPFDEHPTYQRRWAVRPLEPLDPDTLLIAVCVTSPPDAARVTSDSCVWTVRTRRP
jgi:Tfp pilus assembly protein PilX